MKRSTAVAIVAAMAEDYIQTHSRECERGRDMLLLLSRISGEALPAAATSEAPTARLRVDPGTVAARVLEVLAEAGEPMAMKAIVAELSGSTKPHNTTAAVRALVQAGRVLASGATSTRRYSLAGRGIVAGAPPAKARGKKR